MIEMAWVPMPLSMARPSTRNGPPPQFLLIRTWPNPVDALFHLRSVSRTSPLGVSKRGLIQVTQSQP